MKKHNQHGLAHIGALLLIAAVIGVVSFVGYRVFGVNAKPATNRSVQTAKTEQALPLSLTDVKPIAEIAGIATGSGTAAVAGLELKHEAGKLVYQVQLSDGSLVTIDARTGTKLKTQAGVAGAVGDDRLPTDFKTTITVDAARAIAQKYFPNGKIEKIELEAESGKIIYSVRFFDKSRVDVNAADGSITRTKSPRTESAAAPSPVTTPAAPAAGVAAPRTTNSGSGSVSSGSSNSGSGSSGTSSGSGSTGTSGSGSSGSSSDDDDDDDDDDSDSDSDDNDSDDDSDDDRSSNSGSGSSGSGR